MIPGEFFLGDKAIEVNSGRESTRLQVVNTGDRPVQVGSHFHFFEANKKLAFDREKAYGKRLDIPAGTAVRFEPGEEKEISLIELGGKKKVYGFNGLVAGNLTQESQKQKSLEKAHLLQFKNTPQ